MLRVEVQADQSWHEAGEVFGVPQGKTASLLVANPRGVAFQHMPAEGSQLLMKRAPERAPEERKNREGASWSKGELAWILFDDEETHWGWAREHFNSTNNPTLDRQVDKANAFWRMHPLPAKDSTSNSYDFNIREAFARRWHIVLSGSGLQSPRPATRFRVLAHKGLKTFGGDELQPRKCPGQPVVWLERQGFKAYHYLHV
jgi:hypothetical protein